MLSLTDYRAPDVVRAVYQHKALQVHDRRTAASASSAGACSRPRAATRAAAAALEAGVSAATSGRRRSGSARSRPTRPAARRARSRCPKSLTTYRIMAVAGDTASRFGSADTEIKVSKPVTLHRRVSAVPRRSAIARRSAPSVTNTAADRRRRRASRFAVSIRRCCSSPARRSTTVQLGAGASDAVRFEAVGARRRQRARADDGAARQRTPTRSRWRCR